MKFNNVLGQKLKLQPIEDSYDSKWVYQLREEEVQKYYKEFLDTPVVKCNASYLRDNPSLGFCFGRATIAHIEGLKRGIHHSSIKKDGWFLIMKQV